MESIKYFILALCVIYLAYGALEFIGKLYRDKFLLPKLTISTPSLSLTFQEAMEILDTIVAHVISDMELTYSVKEIKYIKNVDDDIKQATNKVMELMSPNIHNNLSMYVTREYIITYISRNIRSFVLAYLDSRK